MLGKGFEAHSLDTDRFKINVQMEKLASAGGKVLACGTCLKLRESEGTDICRLSTMADLYGLVAECDKVLTL